MDALQEMRRGDIGEIERRILAQQHHVKAVERLAPGLAEREVIAGLVTHGQELNRSATISSPTIESLSGV